MTDALELFRAMRPSAPNGDADIRQPGGRSVPTVGGSVDLHQLAMVPGSAAYRQRIPKPPCYRCGEDHHPGVDYGHEWEAEPVQPVHDEPVSATAMTRRPTIVDAAYEQATSRRVALYVGRGDTYVVAVEEAPDWDSVQSFKVVPEQMLPMIEMARALGVKIADKTGGDLVMFEQEAAERASQYAQAHARGPAGPGGDQSRRQGAAADREEEGEPAPAEPADGELPGGSRERRRPPRRAQR